MISIVAAAATVAACATAPEVGSGPGSGQRAPERLGVEVVEVLPHDPDAFTQGLEIAGDTLYESTGLVGESTLRAGPVGAEPTAVASLEEPLFGEGITVVGDRVWQLTWRGGVAVEWDRETLTERRRADYSGEGWGLCHQPGRERLVASDGSPTLTFRDPDDFSRIGSVTVTDSGTEVDELNELECVGDEIYANVWHSDDILRIDPESGTVTARIDASGLLDPAERQDADVLNGIAAYGDSGYFLLTGKLWPKMFKVRFVPSG
ncbi:glutaminyl-peptide cyclotransferase [Saccharomonospora saliphila]|uniref:glutaminyl-peptide cyclotransferase n=1 Tax=Saccharomonospora saliphila TaxID=369829 RepID=UPI0006621FF5|nr:glutaminyl-peptide cyclotransferase [Saccharomonospora saliphila]